MEEQNKDVNQLIARFREGDGSAFEEICNVYGNMVKSIARAYFLIDGDNEDLLQEGFLGLLQAVNGYEENSKGTFSTYAYTCISNNVKKAVRKSNSKTNLLLSNAVPIETVTLISRKNPEDSMIKTEAAKELNERIKSLLSPLEYQIFYRYIAGLSYKEIADETEKSIKSVDNALKRIKRKLSKSL